MMILDKFKYLWKAYLFQCLLAGVVVCIVVVVLGEDKVVLIASMGGTAFICFAMPKSASAQTKHIIGGHCIGLVCGGIFMLTALPYYVEFPCVIVLSMFLMVLLGAEHPPAAGTALAATLNEVTLSDAALIILITILITQCRYHLRGRLRDLI